MTFYEKELNRIRSIVYSNEAQINIGSGMQIFALQEELSVDQRLRTHLYRTVDNAYYVMAAMQNAGLTLEWVRKLFGLSWEGMYQLAPPQAGHSLGLIAF